MIVSDEVLITSIVDAQPESVIWFAPVYGFDEQVEDTNVVDFEVRYLNHVSTLFLQSSKEVVLGQRISHTNLLDEDTKEAIIKNAKDVWHSGQQHQFTFYSRRRACYFNVLLSKVLNGILTVTRDYNAQVEAEKKLKHHVDLLDSILDASVNGIFACEAIHDDAGEIVDMRFLKFNKRFLNLTDKTEEDLLNTTYLTCFPFAKYFFDLNCTVIKTGKPVRKEVHVTDNGLNVWYDLSLAKLGDNGLVVTFTDVTEMKKDKEAIEASAQNLQNAIDSSQTGITVIYPEYENGEIVDFRYKVVNQTFSQYIGRTPNEMVGQLLIDMFPSYKAQGTFDRYKKIYTTGEAERFDLHYVKDGYDVWVDILAKKVGDEILVTFHDYTPLKKAQLQLETFVKDLTRSNRNLEDFAYAASHDLQEPLRKVHFFADKLKNTYIDKLDVDGVRLLEKMESATERMRKLIDDLLIYSQINMKPKEDEKVDINDVVDEALTDLETKIQEKKARITTDILPVVKGDRPQLRQLFQNLVSNSLKYVEPDCIPFISIRSKEVSGRDSGFTLPSEKFNEQFHLIEITDNGIGFDQNDAEKIFNVFQRLHGKTEYSGTGVGLAIAKKVVDNHQGYITAHSKTGQGATFCVLLPVSK